MTRFATQSAPPPVATVTFRGSFTASTSPRSATVDWKQPRYGPCLMLFETSSHSRAPSSATATGDALPSSATQRAVQLLLETVYKARLRTLQLLLETLTPSRCEPYNCCSKLFTQSCYAPYNCYSKLFIQTSPTTVIVNSLHNLATSSTAVIGNSLHSLATNPSLRIPWKLFTQSRYESCGNFLHSLATSATTVTGNSLRYEH